MDVLLRRVLSGESNEKMGMLERLREYDAKCEYLEEDGGYQDLFEKTRIKVMMREVMSENTLKIDAK